MAYLKITIMLDSEDVLQRFPYREGQYLDQELDDTLFVELGEEDDTTAAQEWFLDAQTNVLGYEVIADA